MTVLIAGGGIGGLTLALSLHQIGVSAKVFESVSELRPLGVGINVLPHAVRELIELGLLDKLDASGVRTRELAYFSKHGKPIWSEPRGIEAGYNWPQFSIHRGTLQQILLDTAIERLGRDNILTSHHLSGWTRDIGRRSRRFHRQGQRQIRRQPRRHVADRRRRHSFGDPRKALSAGRPADLERAHPVARHHQRRCVPVGPHHDHGRPRNPEIRLLFDFETTRRVGQIRDQLGCRAAHAADLPMAARGLQPHRAAGRIPALVQGLEIRLARRARPDRKLPAMPTNIRWSTAIRSRNGPSGRSP